MVAAELLKWVTIQCSLKSVRNTSRWQRYGWNSSLTLHRHISRRWVCTSQYMSSSVQGDNKPIRYTTSGAKQWQSIKTFELPDDMKKMPPYQPYSVIISMLAILVYFGMLREENDMDDMLGVSLYERMPGLEEKNIRIAIDYERSLGRSTKELERRLSELEQMRAA